MNRLQNEQYTRRPLVYIVAVLFFEPIFTQPLGFVLCAAGAVEKFATDGTVSVVYLRDSISISKINAAFLTGQQIDRIHVQQLLLPSFMCQGHNACYCTMCRPKRPLLF